MMSVDGYMRQTSLALGTTHAWPDRDVARAGSRCRRLRDDDWWQRHCAAERHGRDADERLARLRAIWVAAESER